MSDSEKARTAEEIADEVWQSLHKKLFIELLESYAAERVREAVDEYDAACFHKLLGIRAEAYKAGQEDMRERAAKVGDGIVVYSAEATNLISRIETLVRSLSIEEKKH